MNNKQTGFTVVELVLIMVILGIISATALPRFFDKNTFAAHAFFDDTLNVVRYAQKLAVATGCDVQVAISSNSYSITRKGSSVSTACPLGSIYSLAIRNPGSGTNSYNGSEAGITLSSTVSLFVFDPLGTASSDVVLTVNGSRTINVVADTGFVYDSTP